MELNGRKVDNSCPYMSQCWADGGCSVNECPPTLLDVLRKTAALEHELGMTPHTDPDVRLMCRRCRKPGEVTHLLMQ